MSAAPGLQGDASSGPPNGAREGERGLTRAEAEAALARHGRNEIERQQTTPRWRMFVAQFASALVLILLAAAVVSAIVGAWDDAVAITVIVLVNGVIGFVQESRAERALLALRSLTAARATVLRDGVGCMVPAAEIVPGDVLLLQAGDVVAADARLLECAALTTIEAVLTGESMPVDKRVDPQAPTDDRVPIAERHDRVFMGTTIATGTARARVEATAMATELGKIAHLLAQGESGETPLQRRLAALGQVLLWATIVLVGIVAVLGWVRGLPWFDVLLTTVSLAVSAVPEGLPAVVTVAMAVGVRRLSARKVLVRRLSTVETLGCATVICTDKTGTLTTGVMTLREHWGDDELAILRAAAACCDAELGDGGGIGDPTELAILAAAAARGIARETIEREQPRVRTLPFDTDRRRMAVWRADGRVYVKGAVEAVVASCDDPPAGIHDAAAAMARRGLRVLAVAIGSGDDESALTLLGLVGLADAPRAEALAAVRAAQSAGVHIVMITGDHALTAEAIARELGILEGDGDAAASVFARKTAADKTAIVKQLRERGEIVAMTGDGVNDAPSIREADIGIAMGRGATEVTREAADMVLVEDDLGGVVVAIREGRVVYDNIRKTVIYLLSGNAAGLIMMLVASVLGWPLPLLPLQLLWLNIMCEPLPGIALAIDPADDDVMQRRPRDPRSPLLGRAAWTHIAWVASMHATVGLGAFWWGLQHGGVELARTLAFSSLVFGVLLRAFASRNEHKLLWEVGWSRNFALLIVVAISVGLQLLLHALPITRAWFSLAPMTTPEIAALLALGFVPVSVVELSKLLRRGRHSQPDSSGKLQ
ncbi:MAG: cation-transporting P-type ATPase [Nannocystaceae bacterium]|nr:cation-transporting P-type ATPase [Nannocystaceae bacterium]